MLNMNRTKDTNKKPKHGPDSPEWDPIVGLYTLFAILFLVFLSAIAPVVRDLIFL